MPACLLCRVLLCSMADCGEMECSVNAPPSTKVAVDSCPDTPKATSTPECAICLQRCVHPVRLPCCHVFCFLCVKGASWQSKRCALCRQEIPEDFLDQPVLLLPDELKAAASGASGSVESDGRDFAWYYEGRNGWWQYDERTSRELEEALSSGRKSTEMLIAGFLYTADLENMVQYRQNEHGRRRKIKRDIVDIPKKGVAGLRLEPDSVSAPTARERVSSADGSDTAAQSGPSSFARVIPPVRPPTLLGHHLDSPASSQQSTLEESLSQLLIGHSEDEELEENSVPQTDEFVFSSDESEEERECEGAGGEPRAQLRHRQNALNENPPARMPPRGGPSSSAHSARSRSPDGQCTVSEVWPLTPQSHRTLQKL